MSNTIKPANVLLLDGTAHQLNWLPPNEVKPFSDTVASLAVELEKTHIVRTSRGIEDEIISFTAFRIDCKTPDHEKTKELNNQLQQVYKTAGSKSSYNTHCLLGLLASCIVDPKVGV